MQGAEVSIQAFDFREGRFEEVVTTTADGSTHAAFDLNFTFWETSTSLGLEYWSGGASGYFAQVKATSGKLGIIPLHEGWWDCLLRHSDESLFRYINRCKSPENVSTICTSDFSNESVRRGPCPRRTLDVRGLPGAPFSIRERIILPNATITLLQAEAFSRFNWRGDNSSIIDVFDASLLTRADFDIVLSHGPSYANFVRIVYPASETGLVPFELTEILTSTPLPPHPGVEWRDALSIRQYDIGACSKVLPWRQLLDSWGAAFPDFATQLNEASDRFLLIRPGIPRESLTPVLRVGESDAFHIFQPFDIDVYREREDGEPGIYLGSINVEMRFTGALSVDALGRIQYTQEEFNLEFSGDRGLLLRIAERLGLTHLEEVEVEMRRRVAEQLEPQINQSFQRAVPALIRIRRVHARPEGFEFVLAEDLDDPQFALVAGFAPALCDRTPSVAPTPITGLYAVLFEPPLPDDPPVFGDSR